MGRNTIRIAAIRRAIFGRETREPICKSLEKTQEVSNAILDGVVAEYDYRVVDAETAPIPNEDEQYKMLVLTRANGT